MGGSMLLPVAVKADKSDLPEALRNEVTALNQRHPGRFLTEAALAWGVIFAAIAAAEYLDHWAAALVAIFIVATRQNVLALLIHEQTHCTGFKAHPGDLITNLIAAYPLLLITVEGYAQVHLSHHSKYFTKDDPDHIRKSGDEWDYPMPPSRFFKILLRDISGLNLIQLIKGKKPGGSRVEFSRGKPIPRWIRPAYLLGIAAILTATNAWGLFLLYWVVPLLTIVQIFIRWGAVCEHQYNREGATVQETTPLILLKWWEKLLLPNLNFSLHIYHHYFPGIGFSQLPKVHQSFVRYGLVDDRAVFHGYGSYLRFILNRAHQ